MKRILLFIFAITMLICFALTACSSPDEKENPQDIQTEQVKETEEESEPTEDPQIALDNEQTLEYLALLGLDENCSYQLADTFPSDVEGKKMFLVSVSNITEDVFSNIQNALESNGFKIVSDIYTDEERKTRSYPYSNEENLYIEMVFSYETEYFDAGFTPFN